MIVNVFVYGTLKPGERNYPHYCQGKVIQATSAYTWGKLFHLSQLGYPALTIGNQQIKGCLLSFADDSILVKLDQLEGYSPDALPSENEYQRQKIRVYQLSGGFLGEVWCYLMTLEKIRQYGGILIPLGEWTEKSIRY
jgi:gamma-glutamylcyclotransferase (GGCT)/AIG2-like uncharacterized protein YtfP